MKKNNKMRGYYLLAVLLAVILLGGQARADLTYTVKKGDNLYKISKKYKIGLDAISKANDLNSNKLNPGTKLIIPSAKPQSEDIPVVDAENAASGNIKNAPSPVSTAQPHIKAEPKKYKVKKGDSLWSIAKKHSISVAEIKQLNKRRSNKLKTGQVLIVGQEPVETVTNTDIQQVVTAGPDPKFAEVIREISETPESQLSDTKEFLISVAQKTIGIPYKFGSNTFKATDCSGYVQMVFNLVGIDLPRSAREQFKIGQSVDKQDLSIGDLVFFQTYAPFPSHVGIYLGNNLFIHASSFAKKVTIESLNVPYYLKRFIGAKRLEGVMNDASLIPQNN